MLNNPAEENISNDTTTYSHIWKISWPIILGGVAQTVINITDSAFLGRVSEAALGAAAIGGLLYVTLMMLGYGFCIGTQIIIARMDGESNQSGMGRIIDHSNFFVLLMAVIAFLILKIGGLALLREFVQSPDVLKASEEYLSFRSFGVFFSFLLFSLRSFFVGISRTKIITYTTAIMAAGNFVLNYALIFGKWGLPEMGAAGAGLASTLSEVLAFLFIVFYTFHQVDIQKYSLFRFHRIQWSILAEILRLAVPVMFQMFIALSSWFIFFMIVEQMGERPLAISNLIRNGYMILMIPLQGLSSATNTLVSNLIGQGRTGKVFTLIGRICTISFLFTLAIMITGVAFPRLLIGIFTNDAELIQATIPSLYVISGALMLFSVAAILLSSVSGIGKTFASMVIETITITMYLIATYMAAIHWKLSIEWVWSVEYVYFSSVSLFSLLYLLHKRKKNFV
jgi:putative MATE family efflux protein